MNISELQLLARKHALANAIKFNGKANPGSVIAKIISEMPEAKSEMKTVAKEVNEIVKHVNEFTIDLQMQELKEKFPEMLEEKKKEERDIFAFLGVNKEKGQVVTAFPPSPEKYPHIGHAKACLLNYMLAKKYDGKFILRFEDTNPNLTQMEFYDIMAENFDWVGAKWDELIYASDFMELFYKNAEKVIMDENAYMCFCNEDQTKLSRSDGIACKCRDHSIEENMKYWRELFTYPEGKATLRLKIDLQHQNTTMRDPTIFRVIDKPHPRHGTKYRVWPNYDFQNSIMDSHSNITIRIRSKEFELRSDLQRHIQQILGITITRTYELARFNMIGVLSSGRVIREKVQSGEYIGWDDPRLTTIVALRRRGFLPEAIKNFVVSTGLNKAESTMTWDDLIIQNKRIVDKTSKRFFMMHDYERITILNAPHQVIKLKYHPDIDELGKRELEVENEFLMLKSDLKELKEGSLYRLMDCLNFTKESDNIFKFESQGHDMFKDRGKKIMHWLPAYGNIDIEILMDDASTITGVAEHNIKQLKVGEVIQFERFGFCRLDAIEKNKGKELYKFWFTHK
jgi:glutamyl-tRNA synthetase